MLINIINYWDIKNGEYEIRNVNSFNNSKTNDENNEGYAFNVNYNKKYDGVFSPYEEIKIKIESNGLSLGMISITNIPFDNNELILSKDDAVKIALDEDKKIQTNDIESTNVKLMMVKINADAYDRINDKEKYYKSSQVKDYPIDERNYYNVENRVRRAWVVVIKYIDNYESDIVKRYTEGNYSYFVDATTGEIIGGSKGDYISSESRGTIYTF